MRITAEALDYLRALLLHPEGGINVRLAAIRDRDGVDLDRLEDGQVLPLHLSADLADEQLEFDYPMVCLFAVQSENRNEAAFAAFSGPLELGAEVRVSADRPDGLEAELHRYVEAVLAVLSASRGEWAPGFVYGGRYAVRFAAAASGGVNFLQSALITVPLEAHL
jgi:hypothetical protein